MENNPSMGYVVSGGLKENLNVRLTIAPQQVQEGAFVTIDSQNWRFYGLVTDLQLGATDARFADEPGSSRLTPALANLLLGQTLYTNAQILPQLMLDRGPDPASPEYRTWREANPDPNVNPIPIKTVPAHHAQVSLATAADIADIFGSPEDEGNFVIGYTREQGHPICLNLDKMVQRSSGIFGATGSGKSFLTRMILAGLIKRNKASVLVFDMHNEYGFDDTASDTGLTVNGLRTLFGTVVQVVSLGPGSNLRGHQPDFQLEIAESDILPEDIEILSRELNLRDTTPTTLEALHDDFQNQWFHEFKNMTNERRSRKKTEDDEPADNSVEAWASQRGINPGAAQGLHSKLIRLFNKKYIVEQPAHNTLKEIVTALQNGRHVVLSFGEFDKDLDYLLVTNIITRKIRDIWEETTNQFRTKKEIEPRPLVIVLEEAHKLLNREMAAQTSFATIAREMRKYYVTLLVVDQRPSQIYDEVMSQLGTRVAGWLGDDDDIAAVLSGLAAKDSLRGMLARLQPKEEILMLGWSTPMPMLVRTRRYDEKFYQDMKKNRQFGSKEQIAKDLWP